MGGFLAQLLNGLQYGLLLFLISSGLTLIFGVMGVINLAHGSLFMIGAYLAYVVAATTGQFWLALPAAVVGGLAFGALLERALFQRFRQRDHLDQVLLTFALILLFEEARASLIDNQFLEKYETLANGGPIDILSCARESTRHHDPRPH